MDRDEAAGVDRRAVTAFVVGVLEHKLATLLHQLAAERDWLAGLDTDARDPVAQPHGVHGPGGVLDGAAQSLPSAWQRFGLEPLEGADHGAFGLKKQLGNWPGGWERLVANRKVEQQILDGADAEPRIQPRADGAHALERPDWRGERPARCGGRRPAGCDP